MPKSRFSSGYYHERAVVVEAIKPDLSSRRILSEAVNSQSESFLTILRMLSERFCTTPGVILLSPFEQDWYHSLLKDRLRRLDALHRIGITHGDIRDHHFRLPDDIYDTVLYDFSESYTFSMKQPFRVNGGRPRPLSLISEGERERVLLHIFDRTASRDLRSHLIYFNSKTSVTGIDSKHTSSVDNALWQSLDEEEELLELIILKVFYHPDAFSMPTLNSIFPFLEAVCPSSDLCWHIRRGRLLHHYESVWAVFSDDKAHPELLTFDFEPQFESIEKLENTRFILCLLPHLWDSASLKTESGLTSLRKICSSFVAAERPGIILSRAEFGEEI
ncbi:unnamed protein product [Penicillium olsonii]|nr:unnamed protein product [Penicillium olsonii]CAG8119853.1 unnamed protein product [Penicillium olsonii]